jgi:hypothetical protein
MAFLFCPKARAFNDESLESYLLRVVSENYFDSYQQLSFAIRGELLELDFEAHGGFPIELGRLNIYHAKHNSHFRMRALWLVESLLGLPKYELQKISLFRSNRTFSQGVVSVQRNGIDIPLSFLRFPNIDNVESIPICPQCIDEEPYIRQIWHLKPYSVCAKHKCELVHNCESCKSPINYILNESITHCHCGFELSKSSNIQAEKADFLLAQILTHVDPESANPCFNQSSTTHRLAALFWHEKFKGDSYSFGDAVEYFERWPVNFYQDLDVLTHAAELRLIDFFNRTSFSFIYGDLILNSRCIFPEDKDPHFIHSALLSYLNQLVEKHPKSKKANVADLLVSVAETAVILSTTHEQVYRLYQDGILIPSLKPKMRFRINPSVGVFYLRQVIEYKKSFGIDREGMHLSAW